MTKVQITQRAFFSMRKFVDMIDTSGLAEFEKRLFEELRGELEEKYNKLYDRMRYGEAVKAETDADKRKMLDLYHKKKGKGMF